MEEPEKQLTDKEQRFVAEYCRDCNATQAAIRAGYSERSAKEIGYENLTKLHIRSAVDARLKSLSMEAAEVTKRIADIASGNINDYYTVREVEHTPRVRKHLSTIIMHLREEMEFEERYAQRVGMADEELASHQKAQARRERQIIRYEMELERNPLATLYVDGEPTVKQVAELDMVKLVQDTERGRVKSIKPGEFGLAVELYPADAALDKLARMHGLYKEDNEQAKAAPVVTIQTTILPAGAKIASSEKDVEV